VVILGSAALIFAISMGTLWAVGNMDGPDVVAMPVPLVIELESQQYSQKMEEMIYEATYTIEYSASSAVINYTYIPWNLTLVNRYNVLHRDFSPGTSHIGGGHYFDARAADSLLEMLASARSEGFSPLVVSGHRTIDRQRTLFNNQYNRQRNNGLNSEEAFDAARRVVAYPGESEHNLGLAVDIVSNSHTSLTSAFGQTPEGRWLAQNSWRYGFVLRYPDHKQHITNIIYEPWHFRYVGRTHAAIMFELDLVLEEYIELLLATNEQLRANSGHINLGAPQNDTQYESYNEYEQYSHGYSYDYDYDYDYDYEYDEIEETPIYYPEQDDYNSYEEGNDA